MAVEKSNLLKTGALAAADESPSDEAFSPLLPCTGSASPLDFLAASSRAFFRFSAGVISRFLLLGALREPRSCWMRSARRCLSWSWLASSMMWRGPLAFLAVFDAVVVSVSVCPASSAAPAVGLLAACAPASSPLGPSSPKSSGLASSFCLCRFACMSTTESSWDGSCRSRFPFRDASLMPCFGARFDLFCAYLAAISISSSGVFGK